MSSTDKKRFMVDLYGVYRAINKPLAEDELLALVEKWGGKMPVV
jgi:hypothetical protein